MSVNLSPVAGAAAQFLDNNGNVLTGGKLFTYLAGTTTPAATYTSSAGAIFHSNPIILDAAGRVQSGGEIWLSDNIQYKFVLKDANDVLIASWDNLSGINSNFVNYTVQEEVQTATAGQTVFNLTTITYAPGTNSLSVYVDGVNQYEGSTYSFVETDATTVTFTAGLHVGALVKFTTAVPATGTATNANVVTYEPAGTGAVVTTVQAKLRETVSVKDFGAVGDGVADDTAAIQAAIDALPTGQTLYGLGATYKVTSSLTLKANMTLENFVIDFSTAGNSAELFVANGSLGSAISVSAGLAVGQVTFTVADGSGFADENYVYIKSSDFWDNWDDLCIMAETHKIKSVVGNSITLHDPILYAMPTTPTIQKITTLDNLTFRNVRAFGSGVGALGDQEGSRFAYCKNLILENCNFTKFDDRCVRLTTCIDFTIVNGIFGQAGKTGIAYGIALQGACINGKFSNNLFFECRHGISLGGNTGPNRYIIVDGNNFTLFREAGMDGHTAADLSIISNNTFQCDPTSILSDGILWRGANVTITDNNIVDAGRIGINILDNVTGAESAYVVNGNIVRGSVNRGISVVKQRENNIKNVVISGNIIQNTNTASDFGVLISTASGHTNELLNIVISDNSISNIANRAIVIGINNAASTCESVVIANNTISSTTFDRGVFISAVTDGNIAKIAVTGNVINGTCNFGIRGTNEEDIVVTNNVIKTASTTAILLTATNNVNANNLT
jgi:hypothetical protein